MAQLQNDSPRSTGSSTGEPTTDETNNTDIVSYLEHVLCKGEQLQLKTSWHKFSGLHVARQVFDQLSKKSLKTKQVFDAVSRKKNCTMDEVVEDHAKQLLDLIDRIVQGLSSNKAPVCVQAMGCHHSYMIARCDDNSDRLTFEDFGSVAADTLTKNGVIRSHRLAQKAWRTLMAVITDHLIIGYERGKRRQILTKFHGLTNKLSSALYWKKQTVKKAALAGNNDDSESEVTEFLPQTQKAILTPPTNTPPPVSPSHCIKSFEVSSATVSPTPMPDYAGTPPDSPRQLQSCLRRTRRRLPMAPTEMLSRSANINRSCLELKVPHGVSSGELYIPANAMSHRNSFSHPEAAVQVQQFLASRMSEHEHSSVPNSPKQHRKAAANSPVQLPGPAPGSPNFSLRGVPPGHVSPRHNNAEYLPIPRDPTPSTVGLRAGPTAGHMPIQRLGSYHEVSINQIGQRLSNFGGLGQRGCLFEPGIELHVDRMQRIVQLTVDLNLVDCTKLVLYSEELLTGQAASVERTSKIKMAQRRRLP